MKQIIWNFWTSLKRFRTSSLLNVIGLAVAFASLYIITVQINYDMYYNHNVTDSERIYRVESPSWDHDGTYSYWGNRPILEYCLSGIASIESYGLANYYPGEIDCTIEKNGEQRHSKVEQGMISTGALKVFNFEAVAGKVEDVVKPNTVIVSESTAKRLGISVGDNIFLSSTLDESKRNEVVAVFKDFPDNTDISKLQVINDLGDQFLHDDTEWGFLYFIKTTKGSDAQKVLSQIVDKRISMMKSGGESLEGIKATQRAPMRITPLNETYFKTDVNSSNQARVGSKTTLFALIAVAVLVIVIAFINFINFFFALVPIRIRSINTRKVFGCSLFSLRSMLVFESFGLVVIALGLASLIVLYAENTHLAHLINTSFAFSDNVGLVSLVVGVAISLSLIASLYPAYYITSFPTAMVVKGSFGTSKAGRRLRYVLVGLQFTISIILIICAMFIHLQHSYMMNYNMGFNKEQVLTVTVNGKVTSDSKIQSTFNSKLRANPSIKDVAWGDGPLVAVSRMSWNMDYKDKQIGFMCYPVSCDFLKFMGIKVEEGRDFVASDELKENGTIIFNMSAKKNYGIVLNDKISGHRSAGADIVGFCHNFNYMPLQYGIDPFAFYVFGTKPWRLPYQLYFRTTANANIKSVISYVKSAIVEFDPDVYSEGIDIKFFDDELQSNYEKEENLSWLVTLFSIMAIIISLMGVFGLVMFETQYRMKEIAVRRVHGASVAQILSMFNLKFIKIVAVCFVIAVPISYYLINYWLGSFTYKMPIYWWVFVLALLIVSIITVITVTVRSYSAATSDPAKMVKSE